MRKQLLYTLPLALTLTACGGGGGGSSSPSTGGTSNATTSLYSGKSTSALLNSSNGLEYMNHFIDYRELSDVTNVTRSQPKNLPRVLRSSLPSPNTLITKAKINTTESCISGGSINIAGELSDSNNTGSITGTYNNCGLENGATLSGKLTIHIYHFDFIRNQPDDFMVSTQNLSLSYAGETYTVTGTQKYKITTSKETMTSDLYRKDSANQIEVLQQLTIVDDVSGSTNKDQVTGKIFDSRYGYVEIFTGDDFELSNLNSAELSPFAGTVYLTGANATKMKFYSESRYAYNILVSLDADGDGAYEQYVSQTVAPDSEEQPFQSGQAPTAKITNLSIETTHYTNLPITLSGYESSDPEESSIDLTYQWNIQSKPTNSNLMLINTDIPEILFSPDVEGRYEITLTVTDSTGKSDMTSMMLIVESAAGPNGGDA